MYRLMIAPRPTEYSHKQGKNNTWIEGQENRPETENNHQA